MRHVLHFLGLFALFGLLASQVVDHPDASTESSFSALSVPDETPTNINAVLNENDGPDDFIENPKTPAEPNENDYYLGVPVYDETTTIIAELNESVDSGDSIEIHRNPDETTTTTNDHLDVSTDETTTTINTAELNENDHLDVSTETPTTPDETTTTINTAEPKEVSSSPAVTSTEAQTTTSKPAPDDATASRKITRSALNESKSSDNYDEETRKRFVSNNSVWGFLLLYSLLCVLGVAILLFAVIFCYIAQTKSKLNRQIYNLEAELQRLNKGAEIPAAPTSMTIHGHTMPRNHGNNNNVVYEKIPNWSTGSLRPGDSKNVYHLGPIASTYTATSTFRKNGNRQPMGIIDDNDDYDYGGSTYRAFEDPAKTLVQTSEAGGPYGTLSIHVPPTQDAQATSQSTSPKVTRAQVQMPPAGSLESDDFDE